MGASQICDGLPLLPLRSVTEWRCTRPGGGGKMLKVGRFLGVSVHETGGAAEFENVVDGSLTAAQLDGIVAVTLARQASGWRSAGSPEWRHDT